MEKKQVSLVELAKLFLKIGTIGFGGGMAIIAMMQDYCVTKKKWIKNDEFIHGIALGQFMGTFAVNASIFVGYRLRGIKGSIVSAVSFLLPSIIIVIALSELYLRFNQIPSIKYALNGVAPVATALILSAAYSMGKNKIKGIESIILVTAAFILSALLNFHVIEILFIGIIYGLIKLKFLNHKESNENI